MSRERRTGDRRPVIDVRKFLDAPEVGLGGRGFRRVSPSVMELRVSDNMSWRVVADKDRDDPPNRVTLLAGIFVPALLPHIPYAVSSDKSPGVFFQNLLVLARRPWATLDSLYDAYRFRPGWLLRRPSNEEVRLAVLEDLTQLVLVGALPWLDKFPDLRSAALWREAQVLGSEAVSEAALAEVGAMLLLAGDGDEAERVWSRIVDKDERRYVAKLRRVLPSAS